jgi:uncharacterized membrane protein HdeD (DUF308 family)
MMRPSTREDYARSGAFRHIDTVTIVLGVLTAIAGLFSLAYAFRSTTIVVVATGLALVAGGAFKLIDAIVHRKEREAGRGIVAGVLYGVVGVMMLARPDLTMLSLTMLLGVLFFATGINRIVVSLATRYAGWGWELASGIMSVILGILVIFNWPISSFWLIGTLVGVELLTSGFALMAAGFLLHRVERRVDEALPSP